MNLTRSVVTTVATTNGWATIYPWQKKIFYIHNLWWLFYAEYGEQVYRTSADGGATWSASTRVILANPTTGHRIAYYFDGTLLHCTFGNGNTGSGEVLYRAATPAADGTLAWISNWQTVHNDAGKGGAYITVSRDSSGSPWVGMIYYDDPAYTAPLRARVYRSTDTTCQTWVTAAGFPVDLISNSSILPVPVGVRLLSGKMFWGFSRDTYPTVPLRGRLWNGSSWGADEDITLSYSSYSLFDLASEGDAVHLAYYDGVNSAIKYRKRSAAGVWGAEVTLSTVAVAATQVTLARIGTDAVRVTWLVTANNTIVICDVVAGVASAPIVHDESADGFPPSNVISIGNLGTDYAGKTLHSYSTKNASPYNVISLVGSPSGPSLPLLAQYYRRRRA